MLYNSNMSICMRLFLAFSIFVSAALPAAAQSAISQLAAPSVMSDIRVPTGISEQAAEDTDYYSDKVIDSLNKNHNTRGPLAEKSIIWMLSKAHNKGILGPVLMKIYTSRLTNRIFKGKTMDERRSTAMQLTVSLGAALDQLSYSGGTWEPWDKMSERHIYMVKSSAFAPRKRGRPSLFTESGFVDEVADITASRFTSGNELRLLVDGPQSFATRNAIIAGAKKSVHMAAWAIYDDMSGEAAIKLLLSKKAQGVDVKIMVDGQTADLPNMGDKALKQMAAAGIQIIRFTETAHDRKYEGMHGKVLIVDGNTAIMGGMNIGDSYSQMNPNGHKWRDTDVQITGPVVADCMAYFARMWNSQIELKNLPLSRMSDQWQGGSAGAAKVAFVAQQPGQEAYIYLGLIKAIYGATSRVNIENAYFIIIPSLKQALLEALARGVEVNILTNSATSVDEPIVTVPILESLPELLKAGANIYLKKGDTLHSKLMTVDGLFTSIGSYNLHPRGIRYENETNINVVDAPFAAVCDKTFEADIAAAQKITNPAELSIPNSKLNAIVRKYFFDQL